MSDGMTDNRSQPDGEASDLPIFARRLAMLRAARRQSLQEVADGASLPRSTAWQLEMGEMDNPGLKVLLALSRHFGVPVSYLTGEGEDEAPTLDLSPDQKAELARLAAMRDDEIDTSDIPETTDWSGAERGKFYRGGVADPRPVDPARLEALRLALKHHPAGSAGAANVVETAIRFLAFLDPCTANQVTAEAKPAETLIERLKRHAKVIETEMTSLRVPILNSAALHIADAIRQSDREAGA